MMLCGLGITLDEKVQRAVELLRQHEPHDGYYVAFSGGKDSQVILRLCEEAGVKHDAHYNVTTIDPPELVKFIRQHYPNVGWNRPEHSILWMIANSDNSHCQIPPTRTARWCCKIYKEHGGDGRFKVIGVRAAESPRRRTIWRELTQHRNGRDLVLCPIVHWSDEDVWEFHESRGLPHCCLYDEGFSRIGCVGCSLAGAKMQAIEFQRWPRFRELFRQAIIRNWERHQPPVMKRDGTPYFHASFATGEEFWQWWISGERRKGEVEPDEQDCQQYHLFTNDDRP